MSPIIALILTALVLLAAFRIVWFVWQVVIGLIVGVLFGLLFIVRTIVTQCYHVFVTRHVH